MPEKIQNNPFNRPPRIQDTFKPEEIDIPAPPLKPEDAARNILLMLLPMGSFLVMGLFYSLAFSAGSGGLGWLYAMPMLGMAGFTFVASFVMYGEQKHEQKQKWIKQLRDYHRLLDKKESRLLSGQILQQRLLIKRFPPPSQLLRRVQNLEINLWERRFEDKDFLAFRLGEGEVPSAVPIKHPDPDSNSPDIRRAFGIYTKYRVVDHAPITIDLRELGSVALVGNRDDILPLSRAIAIQLAALNSPDDINLYVFSSQPQYRTWKWLRWLPHTSEENIGGHPTFLAFTRDANKRLITEISKTHDRKRGSENEQGNKSTAVTPSPIIVALFDDEIDIRDEQVFHELLKNGQNMGVYSIVICDRLEDVPSNCQSIIEFSKDGMFHFSKSGHESMHLKGTSDGVGIIEAENLAHRLLPVAIRTLGKNSRIPTRMNFLQTYQVNRIDDLKINDLWRRLPQKNGLLPFPVYIGSETYAIPLTLNLAENNDGPHGMIAGTTGSGKSELLQTLISALALEHHPYYVNFLLIDFKGGSTFGIFENLPHVVGLVSNLDKLSALRALEAIKAENVRRQRFLKEQGIEDINEYHTRLARLGTLKPSWKPLPHLFIVVDEFAQLAHSMPNFLPELVSIGQVGRSLGIHLILSTQRPGGVVTDEMRANLNFRISLRVQTIDDSRDMLRRPDAAYLPHNLPGRAYFQLGDGGTPRQFQVARAGVEYEPEQQLESKKAVALYKLDYEEAVAIETANDLHAVSIDSASDILENEENQLKDQATIATALSSRLENMYQQYLDSGFSKISRILLPQLPLNIDIIKMHEMFDFKWEEKKWHRKQPALDKFEVNVGQRDDLVNCNQPLFSFDFLNYGGHIMAVGGPQSGKTNFLKTLAYSLVVTYSPEQVHIYAVSFAGRELEILEGLPHVGAVIQGSQSERVHRLIRFLQLEIESRNEDFSRCQAHDLVNYNRQAPEPKPFIVVLIDNFAELRNMEHADELVDIERLIQNGRTCGIHFVLTALQSNDVPYKIANLIQQRIAFNLADHTEYQLLVGRPDSLEFDILPPGRGFVSGSTPPMQCQIGLAPDKVDWEKLSSKMKAAWNKENNKWPQPIQVLETRLYLSDLFSQVDEEREFGNFVVGTDGDTLRPFRMNWSNQGSHLLIGGPPQSGRTSLLHTFTLSMASKKSPAELWVVLMDGSNGSLRQLEELPHVIEWVNEEEGLARNIASLQKELAHRKALRALDPKVTFPEILFIVDDYDLTCEALALNDEILKKLGRMIRQDSELGFHFLIAGLPDNLSSDPLIKQLKLARSGISLGNTDTFELLGGRPTSAMRNLELPQGRGYFLSRSGYRLVQFGIPNNAIEIVQNSWKEFERAKWRLLPTEQEIQRVRDESASVQGGSSYAASSWKGGSLLDMTKSVEMYKQQQQNLQKGQRA